MRTLTVGQLELSTLDDGTWEFPARFFFGNVPEAEWRRCLQTDAEGKIPIGHNYGLLKTARELIVIDTGYGDETHGGKTGHLLEDLERGGYHRDQVGMVIITHAHGDHIRRNTLLLNGERQPAFPHARYVIARAEWDWFSGPGHVPEFDEQIASLHALGMLTLVQGELQLTPEVRLLPTPGHTPGHTSVLIASQGQHAIYLGDLCHHPLHFSHPDWTSSFDTHPDITPRTRATVFALAAELDALLICPHAPAPGFGHVRRIAGGFEWDPLV